MNNEFENNNNMEGEILPDEEKEQERISFNAQDAQKEETFEHNDTQEDSAPSFTLTRKEKKKGCKWMRVIALSLVAGIVFGTAFGFSSSISTKIGMSKISIGSTNVSLKKAEGTSAGELSSVTAIADACMPAIVAITNRSVSDVMTFFGKYSQESTSSGSGIIIGKNDAELLIVTNYHVVANSKELSVVFSPVESKLEMQAQQSDMGANTQSSILENEDIPTAIVKGYDSDKDLAVIAVALKDIPADVLAQIKVATIGDSATLKPGDQVVAIGNALGYGQSVTTGIISAVNRKITMESADGSSLVTNSFIQTDAAINQGNSGGALLDMQGNVIGINSVKIATTGVEGMGYAIPISDVGGIIDELMLRRTRSVVEEDKQGFLGITGADVSSSMSQTFGIPVGVFVESVMENLGAQKAGIKKGYVITKFDGYSVTTIAQLQERLRYYKAGEKVEVTVKIPAGDSKYEEKVLKVTLSNRSENIEEND